jgi:hypothetical protein
LNNHAVFIILISEEMCETSMAGHTDTSVERWSLGNIPEEVCDQLD